MNNKKHWFLLVLLVGLVNILIACGNNEEAKTDSEGNKTEVTTLRYTDNPGSVSLPELAEDLGYLEGLKLDYQGVYTGGPENIQLVATGQLEFGFAFNGALVKSASKNVKIKSVVGAYGSDENTNVAYLTLEDSGIKEAKDLIGKTIGVNTLGAHVEIVLKGYLEQSGLTKKEIEQITLVTIPAANTEQALRNKQIDAAGMLGFVKDRAIEKGGLVTLFTDFELYGTFTAGNYFFSEEFIEQNPTTVKIFVDGVSKAIEWARTTPVEEVIAHQEDIIENRGRKETTDNIKYWKSSGLATEGGVIQDSDYQVWADWFISNGDLKEGEVEVTDLYTNEFNSYSK